MDITYLKFSDKLYIQLLLWMTLMEKLLLIELLTIKKFHQISESIISIKYKDLILHSDNEAVYTCPNFQNFVKQNGITMSMSRKGTAMICYYGKFLFIIEDRSILFSRIKSLSSKMVIVIVSQYIDYYNKERIQAKLNYLSPVKYKKKVAQVVLYYST